ncbi:MAG: hypothetical protein C4B59_11240 [Candidatus Methanogaster sp.]|uniref:Uncharacterized protein n=1 Tax=Candidatus Methanogaster sp. TaxID=3386292 RepID=A0AC61L184_9EURY|nr:MAG: hypothetical protein C4B59_11240 [ANME-2 cluster archaeon]
MYDARHDIYWFATVEVVTLSGALVLTGLFSDIQNLGSEIGGSAISPMTSATPDLRAQYGSIPNPHPHHSLLKSGASAGLVVQASLPAQIDSSRRLQNHECVERCDTVIAADVCILISFAASCELNLSLKVA